MRLLLPILVLLGQLFLPCHALSSGLLVVYPSVKAPYDKIYQDIITGIVASYPGISKKLELTANGENNTLKEKIEQYQPKVLVTLGKHSLDKVRQLKPSIPIVAGAITKTKGRISGVSMTPDSAVVLAHLLTIAPFVKRVYVVTDTSRKAQLESARTYLAAQGKSLQTAEVDSVQQAADKYLHIINQASASDAIWLMRGASLNDPSILMLILKAAWEKKIVVFSSNPTHVKRGALFSIYPDNEKMGSTLANIALQREQHHSKKNTGLVPLRSIHLIVNQRTSKHLGIMPNRIRGLNIHRLL